MESLRTKTDHKVFEHPPSTFTLFWQPYINAFHAKIDQKIRYFNFVILVLGQRIWCSAIFVGFPLTCSEGRGDGVPMMLIKYCECDVLWCVIGQMFCSFCICTHNWVYQFVKLKKSGVMLPISFLVSNHSITPKFQVCPPTRFYLEWVLIYRYSFPLS